MHSRRKINPKRGPFKLLLGPVLFACATYHFWQEIFSCEDVDVSHGRDGVRQGVDEGRREDGPQFESQARCRLPNEPPDRGVHVLELGQKPDDQPDPGDVDDVAGLELDDRQSPEQLHGVFPGLDELRGEPVDHESGNSGSGMSNQQEDDEPFREVEQTVRDVIPRPRSFDKCFVFTHSGLKLGPSKTEQCLWPLSRTTCCA